jgi:acyl-coenzyme A thioesterase PaaI-like protein
MGQYAGFLHAGMIAALLDTACGFAATTTSGMSVISSQFSMQCLAPAVGEEFVAIGRVDKAGRKQVFTSGQLFAVRDGVRKLVATATTLLVP